VRPTKCGAGDEPLFFLYYYATGKLRVAVFAEAVVARIVEGCVQGARAGGKARRGDAGRLYTRRMLRSRGFAFGVVERTRESSMVVRGCERRGCDHRTSPPRARIHGYALISKRAGGPPARDCTTNIEGRNSSDQVLTPTRIDVKPLLDAAAGEGPCTDGDTPAEV